jgi:hypothetical protein
MPSKPAEKGLDVALFKAAQRGGRSREMRRIGLDQSRIPTRRINSQKPGVVRNGQIG